ncbi:hypothetical protein FOCG_17457 [Fusarium oxysporum f. sp. radicis-lycopersici 26381]|nr:hypothetical protein FOCG_17457 [Fusarium oxysporum f. sp. radicis-lycopersici 26381]
MASQPYQAFGASLRTYAPTCQPSSCNRPLRSTRFNNKTLSNAVIRCRGREFAERPFRLRTLIQMSSRLGFVSSTLSTTACPARHPVIEFHIKVYQIGDKYGIESPKKQAITKFRAGFAEQNDEDLATIINLAYTTTLSTDRGLRLQ